MTELADIEALERAVRADPGGPQFAVLAEAYRRAGRNDDARRVAVAGLAVRPDDTAGRLALGLSLLDLGETAAARYELERAMGTVTDHPSIAIVPSRDLDATFNGDIPIASPNVATEGATPEALHDAAIADDELEAAFADAESVPDEMLDANRIAAQAIVDGELDEPEGFALEEAEAFEPGEDAFQLEASPAFATETMARLLADQGDARGAEVIRGRLSARRLETTLPLDAAVIPTASSAEPIALEDDFQFEGAAPGLAPSTRAGHSALSEAAYTMDSAAARRGRIVATLETWLENLQRGHA